MNPAVPPPAPAPPPSPRPVTPVVSTLRRDLFSAYAASGAKVLSWVVVSALVFRVSPAHFAVLALVRGTLGLLNYTTVGLLPALVRLLAAAQREVDLPQASRVLDYARPAGTSLRGVYSNGLVVALGAGVLGQLLVLLYAAGVGHVHHIPGGVPEVTWLVLFMGIGFVLRLISEAPAAAIQASGAISHDNWLVVASELTWIVLSLFTHRLVGNDSFILLPVGVGYAASGLMVFVCRADRAKRAVSILFPKLDLVEWRLVKQLLAFGSIIAAAQLADFLYAPVDYILINRLISAESVAAYAPVVQVNAGLLLLVGALSAVVLPRAAVAHAAGDATTLRRYYVRGTLAAAGMLAVASIVVWLLSPWLFRLWLGDPLPAAQAVLPLVLLHTVLGGSGGVGRSVLLAAGKAKPYAAAVLITGVAHVVLSYVFVRYLGWGLQGVAAGTVAAAVGLCVAWQPWYVLRTLRRVGEGNGAALGGAVASEVTGATATTVDPL